MEKSIIYIWNKENIEKAPEGVGIYILRTTPVNGDITFLNESSNLKNDLLSKFESGNFEEVKYFDWYKIETLEEAVKVKEELVKKYHLEEVVDL